MACSIRADEYIRENRICSVPDTAFESIINSCAAEARRLALEEAAQIAESPEQWKKIGVQVCCDAVSNLTIAGKKIAAAIRNRLSASPVAGRDPEQTETQEESPK
jgi:hypothetical protein